MIIDTHAHYEDARFDEDRDALIASFDENGIAAVVNASAEMAGCRATVELVAKYPKVYGMLGLHPDSVLDTTEEDIEWIRANATCDKIVAIGEIGLDYYGEDSVPVPIQKKWFVRQIALAKELGLPINVHSRDAAKDTMDIIIEEKAYECGGIIHCFSYSPEVALEYIKMGFYIGIGGVVTFKNAKKAKDVVQQIPLERIVLETDCPYLAPTPFRGERNSSLYLPYVVEEIASLKGVSTEEVLRVTENNAREVYRI